MDTDVPDFESLMQEMKATEQLIIICTVMVAAAIFIILPFMVWVIFRKSFQKTNNLLEYYEKLNDKYPEKV
jgi:branched-subunit amino acid transport protein AzlD